MSTIVEGVKPRKQLTEFSCGPASLRSLFYFYGLNVSEKELVDFGEIEEDGTDIKTMRKIARAYGFTFYSKTNASLADVQKYLVKNIPVLICYQLGVPNGKNGHYSVVSGISKDFVQIADPSNFWEGDGKKFANNRKMTTDKFLKAWFDMDNGIKIRKWFAILHPRSKKKKK